MQIPRRLALATLVTVGFAAVACGSSNGEPQATSDESSARGNSAVAAAAPVPVKTPTPVAPQASVTTPASVPASNPVPAPAQIDTPAPTSSGILTLDPRSPELVFPIPVPTPSPRPLVTADAPARLTGGWKTDFSKHSVPYSEILSGGPPRDGIAPIDSPKFDDVADAASSLRDNEPVISLEINGEAKAYPIAILIWHEIVNDEIGGVPVTVTYCPLCNTALVFDRRVDGQILDFGTSGKLRNSDLIMWDRQTESWWQQITGEAIVGSMTGTKLKFIPAPMVSWADFRESFADGQVLSRDTGFARSYGRAPYRGYDALDNRPFLFTGQIDSRLVAMERVVGLAFGDEVVAYPFMLFESHPVVNDTVGGQDIAIFYVGGTLSAFDGAGASASRQVGSTGVFDPNLDGQKLTFRVESHRIVDDQTGSTWNILGKAIDGPLQGSTLEQVAHANHFWFAWSAFNPETEIRSEETIAGN